MIRNTAHIHGLDKSIVRNYTAPIAVVKLIRKSIARKYGVAHIKDIITMMAIILINEVKYGR